MKPPNVPYRSMPLGYLAIWLLLIAVLILGKEVVHYGWPLPSSAEYISEQVVTILLGVFLGLDILEVLALQTVPEKGRKLGGRKEDAMPDRLIKFSVHCPTCKKEWTSALKRSEIVEALKANTPIRVYADCHDANWDLDASERAKLSAKVSAP